MNGGTQITLPVRVADAYLALAHHEEECHEFACLMRDGCPEWDALMTELRQAALEYKETVNAAL